MRPLAVIGHLALDLFAGAPPRIGGAPWYAGRALRLLGDEATLFAKCGTDDRARFQRRLASLGLPASLSTGGVTTSFTFLYDRDGERTMTVETISAGDVDAAYDRVVAGDVRFRFVIDTSTITA